MKSSIKLAAAGAALALFATACGANDSADPATTPSSADSSSSSSSSQDATAADASATEAAELRANLTGLLHDHVWLAGNALQTAVLQKGDLENKQVKGAVAALDDNSVELSKAIGAAYPEAEEPFLASWRQHIGFFVDYTLGKATKDQAKVEKALSDLDGYRTGFGQLISSVVPELPADAVAEELKPHVASLTAAIDAAVASDPSFQSKLGEASHHMVMTAAVLADGIAANKGLEGDAMGTAATTRATLTGQLNDHVWLAGNALQTAVRQGGDLENKQVKGAVAALDENSVALSKTIASVYPEAEEPFLTSWRQHIGFFVDYTLGKATKDQAMADKALEDLDGYRTAFGQLFNSVVPELPADAIAAELEPHVESLTAAIDAAVASDPQFQQKLDEAAHHMTMTAATLTSGIVANKMIKD